MASPLAAIRTRTVRRKPPRPPRAVSPPIRTEALRCGRARARHQRGHNVTLRCACARGSRGFGRGSSAAPLAAVCAARGEVGRELLGCARNWNVVAVLVPGTGTDTGTCYGAGVWDRPNLPRIGSGVQPRRRGYESTRSSGVHGPAVAVTAAATGPTGALAGDDGHRGQQTPRLPDGAALDARRGQGRRADHAAADGRRHARRAAIASRPSRTASPLRTAARAGSTCT